MLKLFLSTVVLGIFSTQTFSYGSVLLDLQGSPIAWSDSTGATGGATAPGAMNYTKHSYRGTVAFQIPVGLYLGGSYSNFSTLGFTEDFVSGTSGGDSLSQNIVEYGPTLGFAKAGFNFSFTYALSSVNTVNSVNKNNGGTTTSDTTAKYQKGSGYQISLSYTFALASKIRLGPALVYRASTHEEQAVKNNLAGTPEVVTAMTTKAKFSGFTPMIGLIFDF